MTDRHQFMIHFCTNTFDSNGTMNSKCKVKRSGADRQHFYITFWRIHINFFCKETGFKILQKINAESVSWLLTLPGSAETIYQSGFHRLHLLYISSAQPRPFSAISFIRLVRICTSTHLPCGPITVVCNAS